MKQRTLQNSFTLKGRGLHTGLDIEVTFKPAPVDHGYKIKRIDLPEQPIIEAFADNVVATQRGTVLGKNDVTVSTVEHALSALYALNIDNCLIEINACEFPILDGSAIEYANGIINAGYIEQERDKDYYIVRNKIEVYDETTGSKITILPDTEFSIHSFIEFDSKYIPNQSALIESMDNFLTQIAPARTFVFVREVQKLRQAGLIKGGNLDNAIVIYEKQLSQDELNDIADEIGVERRDATKLGYLNNRAIQFPNEPARHKILDLIGDLALIGKPIKGRVIATKPGHGINNKMARLIRKDIKLNEVQPPIYSASDEPLMDINKIRSILPHRYPFLLVDKVVKKTERYIVAVKNITNNEPYFVGHFPEEPVMPGVLQIEAMAQVGGIFVLSDLDEPERYSTYFMKIDGVKFRQKVIPGDTLLIRVELQSDFRRGIASMRGLIFVGDTVVSEANFTAQIVKNK